MLPVLNIIPSFVFRAAFAGCLRVTRWAEVGRSDRVSPSARANLPAVVFARARARRFFVLVSIRNVIEIFTLVVRSQLSMANLGRSPLLVVSLGRRTKNPSHVVFGCD